ncbi:MAG: GGDEF domain-containing protein [Lachnospiraceae bacterium]|nr:GGDEF domain-containing protein [Lachnospiraceae bacterium]
MKLSLKRKAVILIIIVIVVMGGSGFLMVRKFIDEIITNQHADEAERVAASTAIFIDLEMVDRLRDSVEAIYNSTGDKVTSDKWGTPEFEEYISRYDEVAASYDCTHLAEGLGFVRDLNGASSVYLAFLDPENGYAVYLVDSPGEDQCSPGCLDAYEEGKIVFKEDESGKIKPYETNTKAYGWLITTGYPIVYNGETIAYAFVDISMDDLTSVKNHYSAITAIVISVTTIVLGFFGILAADKYLINPIRKLTDVASSYKIPEASEVGELELCDFARLDIRTADEIQVLSESMKKMERDLNEQIENLFATKQELISTREHAEVLNELANRDALTGIRNKRGYDIEVQRINRNITAGYTGIGIVMVDMNDLRDVNDKYGHETGDRVICGLCDILCSIFKRSPVFRIGGDEFVVVAENQDLRNIDKNIETFRASIERSLKQKDLEPWQRVSAAIGYAIYDPDNDCGIEDTLGRADARMYEEKKAMKERLKNSGEGADEHRG